MRMEEYLTAVTEQIRCGRAREPVRRELASHIEEQADAYEESGMTREEAVERAVAEMGDPVEAGVSMDRIHRPRMSWGALLTVGLLSLLGIAAAALTAGPDDAYSLRNQAIYTALGYAVMFLVYRLDYSVLARYGRQAAAGVLLLLAAAVSAGVRYNGAVWGLMVGPFIVSVYGMLWLYVPLYGAVLYHYRGEGYRCFWKLALWAAAPVLGALACARTFYGAYLLLVLGILTSAAVWNGWYRVNRKGTLAALWAVLLAAPAILAGYLAAGRLPAYQEARMRSWLTMSAANQDHQAAAARRLLSGSRLIGSDAPLGVAEAFSDSAGEYVLVSLASVCGVLAAAAALALMLFLILKTFRICSRQKNQLGRMLGWSCGTVFLVQFVLAAAVNLGLLPNLGVLLPFLSAGGTNLVVSYALLGLALSVYRYRDLFPGEGTGRKRKTPSKGGQIASYTLLGLTFSVRRDPT
ncbi:MAG: FtsW/RodA/SpoVE family cell cycle protein [Eubacteriales bacterium]|nr:FtsW/RodA/SpoVE family cell cycle protein [Eubacteriales bacterium]